MTAESRVCPDCGAEKPASAFRKNKSRPDRLSHYCKPCFKRRDKAGYERRQIAKGKQLRERPAHVPDGHKYCPSCKEIKPHSRWDRAKYQAGGLYPYCKECRKAKGSDSYYRRTYGLTKPEVEQLAARQQGLCGICQVNPAEHVDHCHETNAVRGMLCFSCNAAIGHLRDAPEIMERATDYVAQDGTEGQRALAAHTHARLERIVGHPLSGPRQSPEPTASPDPPAVR